MSTILKDADWVEALAFYNRGIPSVLPEGNRFKATVENHRWGKHWESLDTCPACVQRADEQMRHTGPAFPQAQIAEWEIELAQVQGDAWILVTCVREAMEKAGATPAMLGAYTSDALVDWAYGDVESTRAWVTVTP